MTLIIIIFLILIFLVIYNKIKKEHYSIIENITKIGELYNSQNNMTINNLNATNNIISNNLTSF